MLQDEYYVVERENNNDYPLFSWDQKTNEYGVGVPVHFTEPLMLRLGDPISPTFEWVDYHKAPEPIVSLQVAKALGSFDIHGVQLIPAKVRNPKDPFSDLHDYYFVHVWNRIACLDKDQSIITTNKAGDLIWGIKKFALDEKTLASVELKNRLIFELAEKTSILLVHQTIKDAIETLNPKGFRFISAGQWNSNRTFD